MNQFIEALESLEAALPIAVILGALTLFGFLAYLFFRLAAVLVSSLLEILCK
jgi:hypothetical protein